MPTNDEVRRASAIQHWHDAIELWKKLRALPEIVPTTDARDAERLRVLRLNYQDQKAEHVVRALELRPDLFGVGPLDPNYKYTVRISLLDQLVHFFPAERTQYLNNADLCRAMGAEWGRVRAAIEGLYEARGEVLACCG